MPTWYNITIYGNEINEIAVIKETPKFITYIDVSWKRERREAKKTSYSQWCRTRKEAIDWRRAFLEGKLEVAKIHLDYAKERLEEFNKLCPEE